MIANAKIQQIMVYVEYYRAKHRIRIGTQHYGDDDLGDLAQLIELLARQEFGGTWWQELEKLPDQRERLYAHVVWRARNALKKGDNIPGWSESAS